MFIRYPLLMAEGDAGTGGGAPPAEMEVDLPEVGKIKLPKEQAEKVIKARDALKESGRKAAERLGALEAEKQAADAAVKKAEEDKALAAAAKAGEIDKVREISNRKLETVAAKYRDRSLEVLIGANKAVLPAAVADIAKQLSASCRFDLESDSLVVIDAAGKPRVGSDGKPMSVDALVAEFLDPRPYLRQPSGTSGSGAAGGGAKLPGRVVSMAEFEAIPPKERAAFFNAGGSIRDS